jgi:hypothetical protein
MPAFLMPLFAFVPNPVPEPGTMLLVGCGVAGTILWVRARRKK